MKKILWNDGVQKTFTGLLIVIFLSVSISTIFILINSNLEFDLTSQGFNNAFNIFKFPLTLLGTLIAIFSIQTAIYKIHLTEINNKINNYFKMMDEFIEFMLKTPLFDRDEFKKENCKFDINLTIRELFKHFYGNNYSTFNGTIERSKLAGIKKYFSNIDNSCLTKKFDLYKFIPLDSNNKEDKKNRKEIEELHKDIYKPKFSFIGFIEDNKIIQNDRPWHLVLVKNIYWKCQLFDLVLNFSGLEKDNSFEYVSVFYEWYKYSINLFSQFKKNNY